MGQRINLHALQALVGWMLLSGSTAWFGKALGLEKPIRKLIMETHLWAACAIGVLVLGLVYEVRKGALDWER